MTLISATINDQQAMMVAERKVTWRKGKGPFSADTKLTYLSTPDARFAIGFTGIAIQRSRNGWFRTSEWLVKTLVRIADAPSMGTGAILGEFEEEVRTTFKPLSASTGQGIEFVFVGYQDSFEPRRGCFGLIGNLTTDGGEALDTPGETVSFWQWDHRPLNNALSATSLIAGRHDLVAASDQETLHRLAEKRVAPDAQVDHAVKLIRRASNRTTNTGVGVDCMSIVIPRDGSGYVRTANHQASGAVTTYFANRVKVSHDGVMAMMGGTATQADEDGTPLQTVRAPVPRNASCPCGSGKRFKRCCRQGATDGFGNSVGITFF